MYAPGNPFPVYCQECWWSDKWDPLSFGRDYDFSKPFFIQYRELLERTPRLALSNTNVINSEYCNYTANNKNCYLCFSTGSSEDCLYTGPNCIANKSCINCGMTIDSEQCYSLVDCRKCHTLFYSQNSENCLNSAFLFNCRGCTNCLGCTNLRNQKYQIFNKQYTKEEYEKKMKEYNLGSYKNLLAFQEEFKKFLQSQMHRYMQSTNVADVSGDAIYNSRNAKWCFSTDESENCKYCYTITKAKDCYDVSAIYPSGELSYENYSLIESARGKFSVAALSNCLDIEYIDSCASAQHLFGCISVRNSNYCILNKQYTKEAFDELRLKIVEHMEKMPYVDSKGRVYKYGEFFPPEFSPFGYNDTLAQEFFPKTKAKVNDLGWRWQEPMERDVSITMKIEEIPDDIANVDDSILQVTIECAHKKQCNESCTGAFKLTSSELAFYRHHNLALPRICIKCRAFERTKKRNPLQLWKRQCQCKTEKSTYHNTAEHFHKDASCQNEFETSFAPDRPEIVYCEQCYQAEVI